MSEAVLQSGHVNSGGTTTYNFSLSQTPLLNSTIAIAIFGNGAATSINISGGGVQVWAQPIVQTPFSAGTMTIAYGVVTGVPTTAMNCTFLASVSYFEVDYIEIAGALNVSPLDQQSSNTGAGTSFSIPSFTNSAANEVVIAASLASGTVTSFTANGFTDISGTVGSNFVVSYQLIAASTSYTAEIYNQNSQSWWTQALSFLPIIGQAGPPMVVHTSMTRAAVY